MLKGNDGIIVFDNVLTEGFFSFDGYLDEKNKAMYFNFGRTGNTANWRWCFEVYLNFGSAPEGQELIIESYKAPNTNGAYSYTFYNIKGFFNYKVKYFNGIELHYINDVLYTKTYYGISGQAKALDLYSLPIDSNDKTYSYYNNIILIDNNQILLDVNMERDYGNYLNTLVPNIPNFFLSPWEPNSLNESFITKKC